MNYTLIRIVASIEQPTILACRLREQLCEAEFILTPPVISFNTMPVTWDYSSILKRQIVFTKANIL